MGIWNGPLVKDLLDKMDLLNDKFEAHNHLMSHQNAALDLLASDKRAALVTDLGAVAELVHAGELLEVMDYGEQIELPWTFGGTEYVAPLNLCHLEDAELEDGETIPVADFEWEYVIPFDVVFDASEAIFESASALPAGTYYFTVKNDSWGGNNDKNICFTLPEDLPAGYQIRKSVGYNKLITTGTLNVYASGADLTPLYTMTPTEEATGTYLGITDGTGDLNHWHRVALGYNRYMYSAIRQWLNTTAAAGSWWTKQCKWDVKPAYADTRDGFLAGYDSDLLQYMIPTKIQTATNTVTDGGVTDVTYDRVFLSSLEQMYCVPQVSGVEGSYWEYYKRLLGRTTPAPASSTYKRLIKYDLAAKTTARYCWRRSAYRGYASNVWYVSSSGNVITYNASNSYRCAPCLRIGL